MQVDKHNVLHNSWSINGDTEEGAKYIYDIKTSTLIFENLGTNMK